MRIEASLSAFGAVAGQGPDRGCRNAERRSAVPTRSPGHDVRVAYTPGAALDVVADFLPQIALLDIGLPEMDGYALAALLRERLGSSAPTMVALSGYGKDPDRAESAAAGFVAHLTKPVDLDHLAQHVASLAIAR
jgi:CheY-like chemotaxis protein